MISKPVQWDDKELQAVLSDLSLDIGVHGSPSSRSVLVRNAMGLMLARGWASPARVAELLAANNAEVERRRGAERCTFQAQEAAKEMRQGVEVADTLLSTAEAIIEELLALVDAVRADAADNRHKLDEVRRERDRLHLAARAVYLAAHWSADRGCDAQALWTELRDALGLKPGTATAALGESGSAGPARLWVDMPGKLFAAIAHGDADHRAWLKSAILAFFVDRPIPRQAGNPARKPDETAWLIEAAVSSPSAPLYLATISKTGAIGWSFGHLCAIRFARKEDGERVAKWLELDARVCDHAWVDLPPPVREVDLTAGKAGGS